MVCLLLCDIIKEMLEDTSMLKRLCRRCNKVIDAPNSYCDECAKERAEKYNKQTRKAYDDRRKDDKHHAFYQTPEWKWTRDAVLKKYNYIDLYELHVNKKIVKANTVHHIIEVREDYDKRLDMDNLFPCSSRTHNKIEKMYRRNKEETQALLRKILQKGVGG